VKFDAVADRDHSFLAGKFGFIEMERLVADFFCAARGFISGNAQEARDFTIIGAKEFEDGDGRIIYGQENIWGLLGREFLMRGTGRFNEEMGAFEGNGENGAGAVIVLVLADVKG